MGWVLWRKLMMKIAVFALLGLAALMVIPSGASAGAAPVMYGAANVELADADGNVRMSQTVHNRVTDEGERFLIDQVFDTGDAAFTGPERVAYICIISDSYTGYSESTTALDQHDNQPSRNVGSVDGTDPADRVSNYFLCSAGRGVDDSAGSTAVLGPVTYVADENIGSNQAIGGFVVCNSPTGSECDIRQGFDNNAAFAAIDINDIRLQSAGDSLTISYTFDISTPGI